MRCGIVHFIHYQYFKWIRTMYSVTLFQSKIDQVELMSMEGIYLGYKTSAKAVTGICCNSTQKQNPQIWVQSWKSETYCHINCFTRRYFFWWSVSESCDLKWPGVFSGFLCFLPIRWRTDLEIEEVEHTENQVSMFSAAQTTSRFEKDKKLVGSSHKTGIMRHWLCSNWFQIVPWWDFNRFSMIHNAAQMTRSPKTLNV